MGLYKRKKKWWFSFMHKGRRIQMSLKTGNRKLAEKFSAKLLNDILEGCYLEKPPETAMDEAIRRYMREVSPLKEGSHKRDEQIAEHFYRFFPATPL
jgi:hypothetical protein